MYLILELYLANCNETNQRKITLGWARYNCTVNFISVINNMNPNLNINSAWTMYSGDTR